MKILHMNGAMPWGGNEQQLVDCVHGLHKLGVENVLVCAQGSELERAAASLPFLQVHTLPHKKFSSFKNRKPLRAIIEQSCVDIIHIHNGNALTLYYFTNLTRKVKAPAVFSKKGMGRSMSFLSKFKYNTKGIKAIICVSKYVLEAMKSDVMFKKNHHKLKLVYEGINTERIASNDLSIREKYDIPAVNYLLGNIANHAQAKDLPTLIHAVHILANELEVKNVTLLQMGSESKLSPQIFELVDKLHLKDYIVFAGFTASASTYIHQFDLYVMSSEREGLPLTIYEAFYMKTAVVSTAAGGIPDVVVHGVNGFVSPVKDAKRLAQNIATLLKDPSLKAQFAQQSYEDLMEHYTTDKTAQSFKMLYESLL